MGIFWQDFQSLFEYVGPCLGRQVNLLNPRLRIFRLASGADSVISKRAAIARVATIRFIIYF